MLHEIEILEVRQIADLAEAASKVRDQLIEKVRENALGEPPPERGAHNPAREIDLNDVLSDKVEFVALRQAVANLPSEIRRIVWGVMEVGRGRFVAAEWSAAMAAAMPLRDYDIATALLDEPNLHTYLAAGLHALGIARESNAG